MKVLRTARVILWDACNKSCSYCANEHTPEVAVPLDRLANLPKNYEAVVLTGGEPFLNAKRVLLAINEIREHYSKDIPVYLYTAYFDQDDPFQVACIMELDGVTYTIHDAADQDDVERLASVQEELEHRMFYSPGGRNDVMKMNNRLSLGSKVDLDVSVLPTVWNEIRRVEFIPSGECPIPGNETLFKLETRK